MKFVVFFILVLFVNQTTFSQTILSKQGTYNDGYASYKYYENENHEEILHGEFSFKSSNKEITIKGIYDHNTFDGTWVYTSKTKIHIGPMSPFTAIFTDSLQKIKYAEIEQIIVCNYKKGVPDGAFEKKVRILTPDTIVSSTKFNMRSGLIIDKFEANDLIFSIIGQFDENGKLEGTWTTTYSDQNKKPYEITQKYKNGFNYFYEEIDVKTKESLKSFDNSELKDKFFNKLNIESGQSKYDDSTYILFDKEITKDYYNLRVINSWFPLYGTISRSPLYFNPQKLFDIIDYGIANYSQGIECEIINYHSTKKGKAEFEKKMKDQRYRVLIQKAQKEYSFKNIQASLDSYKEANELYKTDTIDKKIEDISAMLGEINELYEKINKIREQIDLKHKRIKTNYKNNNTQPILLKSYLRIYNAYNAIGYPPKEENLALLEKLDAVAYKMILLEGKKTKTLEKELETIKVPDTLFKMISEYK